MLGTGINTRSGKNDKVGQATGLVDVNKAADQPNG